MLWLSSFAWCFYEELEGLEKIGNLWLSLLSEVEEIVSKTGNRL